MSENNCPPMTAGLFGWNELVTSDAAAAKQFYGEVFGWTSETKAIVPGWDYTMFKLGDAIVGGMIELTPEMGPAKPQWMSYLFSADVAGDLAKAVAAGATILKEATDVPNTGTLGILRDPQGAVFGLWKCTMTA